MNPSAEADPPFGGAPFGDAEGVAPLVAEGISNHRFDEPVI